MTIKTIVKMGSRQLLTPSLQVTNFVDPTLKTIIADMRDTMLEKKGVGIAAPQIGHNLCVVMFGFESNLRYPDEPAIPFTILINPEITVISEELVDGWEGCLSVPGLRGLVPRYKKIQYQGYDTEGQFFQRIAEDFHARVVQHECDHLAGILYPQRIKDMHCFGYEDELVDMIWPE
jgi:peptide deformylase